MRLIGYVRVSSRNKRDQEESAPEQERAIRAWCQANGHRLVEVFRDVGVSGALELDQRQHWPDVEAAIQAGRADGVVAHQLDRLHRDMLIQEQMFADLWRIRPEVEIFSTKASEAQNCRRDDADDPARRLIRQVLGAVAEYVRAQTVARMAAGKRRKRSQGGYIGGQPRYGQRSEDKQLVADDAEQAAITRITELRAQVDPITGEPTSYRRIAATLTAEGHRPKRSERWHPMKVKAIIDRL